MFQITYNELKNLYSVQQKTDKAISEMYSVSEDVIRYHRDKYNIRTNDKRKERRKIVKGLSDEQFKEIILNNNYRDIQKVLKVSSVIWKKELRIRGIESKSELRINRYPELNKAQRNLLIGGLLGDGGIYLTGDRCSRYSEGHAPNQLLYLKKKFRILKPFSRSIYTDRSHKSLPQYRFNTVAHPNFNEFHYPFYKQSINGKLIPVDFIDKNWDDDILAYWFLDDGSFDSKSGCYTISNGCPDVNQLQSFMDYLSDHYRVRFKFYTYSGLYQVKIPLEFKKKFIDIIMNVVTDDMLYKVPKLYKDKMIYVNKAVIPNYEGTSRIIDIKHKIFLGYKYEDLKKEYPITKALYTKLGGEFIRYFKVNHPYVKEIVGSDQILKNSTSEIDEDVVLGTIIGDGNIFKYGKDSYLFSFAHSTNQMSYVKLKYEMLKKYVTRVIYVKNTTNDYYSFHVFLRSLSIMEYYRNLFYTAKKEGKKHLQKYVFKDSIVERMSYKSFAIWIMDDGKKYGKQRYDFTVTIAKQPYYNYKDFKKFVLNLNDKLDINMRAREEKISYEITTPVGGGEKIFEKVKDYVWPYFSYKFASLEEDCGQYYKAFSWFSEWRDKHACMYNM